MLEEENYSLLEKVCYYQAFVNRVMFIWTHSGILGVPTASTCRGEMEGSRDQVSGA